MQNDNLAKKNVNDGKVTSSESSHPVGTTLGTIGGMAAGVAGSIVAGAAAGAAVGPVGAAIGAVIGAGIGAGTGHEIAAQINPKAEDDFWRNNYQTRPYVTQDKDYDFYQPAYRYGVDSYSRNQGRPFSEVEPSLSGEWNKSPSASSMDWNSAKPATQDAYERLLKAKKNS